MKGLIGGVISAVVVWIGIAWIHRPEPWNGFFDSGVLNDHYDDYGGYLLISVGMIGLVFSVLYIMYLLAWMDNERNTLGAAYTQNQVALHESERLKRVSRQ